MRSSLLIDGIVDLLGPVWQTVGRKVGVLTAPLGPVRRVLASLGVGVLSLLVFHASPPATVVAAPAIVAAPADYYWTTLVGAGSGHVDGAGPQARFNNPGGVALDAPGALYVADTGNHVIRRIAADGSVTTVAGVAGFDGTADGFRFAARFSNPIDVDVDAAGNVYVVDGDGSTVRRIAVSGQVTTIAGAFHQFGNVDGTGTTARFAGLTAIAAGRDGSVYVADPLNHAMRQIAADGRTSTIATAVTPSDLAVEPSGSVVIVDGSSVRRITTAGAVSNVASLGVYDGSALIAVDPAGTIYAYSSGCFAIYDCGGQLGFARIGADGSLTRLLPTFGEGFASPARGFAVDPQGRLIFATGNAIRSRSFASPNSTVTIAGTSTIALADGNADTARLPMPSGLTIDASGTLFVADQTQRDVARTRVLRRITSDGTVSTISLLPAADQNACSLGPSTMVVDASGTFYFSWGYSEVCRMTPGAPSRLIPLRYGTCCNFFGADLDVVTSLALDPSGNVVFTDTGFSQVDRTTPNGDFSVIAGQRNYTYIANRSVVDGDRTHAQFKNLGAIAVDSSGLLYVVDNQSVRLVQPDGTVRTIAGQPDLGYGAAPVDGVGADARLSLPSGLAVGPDGSLFFVDAGTIRHIDSHGAVTTIGGLWKGYGTSDGSGSAARFGRPGSITVDRTGVVYVLDGDRIRRGVPTRPLPPAPGCVIESGSAADGHTGFGPCGSLPLPPSPSSTKTPASLNVLLSPAASTAVARSLFGQIDAPASGGSDVRGALVISGWLASSTPVARIAVYRACVPAVDATCDTIAGTRVVPVVDAALVPSARPDVNSSATRLPGRALGLGAVVPTLLLPDTVRGRAAGGQGRVTLMAFAFAGDGTVTPLATPSGASTVDVTLNNDMLNVPAGAIDADVAVSAAMTTWTQRAWVVTPDGDSTGSRISIPADGSTLQIFIDGVAAGRPRYSLCGGDALMDVAPHQFCNDGIDVLLGGASPRRDNPSRFRNLDSGLGPQAVWTLQNRRLPAGLHTVSVWATDSAGRSANVGTQVFRVGDGDWSVVSAAPVGHGRTEAQRRSLADHSTVLVRSGFDDRTPWRTLLVGSAGVRTMSVDSLGRIELLVHEAVSSVFLVMNGELLDPPVGSTFDAATGRFSWTPPSGYRGTYRLQFVGDAMSLPVDVVVGR